MLEYLYHSLNDAWWSHVLNSSYLAHLYYCYSVVHWIVQLIGTYSRPMSPTRPWDPEAGRVCRAERFASNSLCGWSWGQESLLTRPAPCNGDSSSWCLVSSGASVQNCSGRGRILLSDSRTWRVLRDYSDTGLSWRIWGERTARGEGRTASRGQGRRQGGYCLLPGLL